MTDEEIDYSEIPPLTEEFFEHATLRIPANQVRSLIQLRLRGDGVVSITGNRL